MNIDVKNLEFGYSNNSTVLNDLSLSFSKGEIWGILGHNGAGKTTLARLIMGLLPLRKGSITFNSLDDHVSYLPETNGIYEKLSCIDNLIFRGELSGLKYQECKERAESLLDLLELKNKRDEHAAFLSQGLKKRLGLACAIMSPYELIILDEPTNGLDPESLEIIKKIITNLGNENRIILMNCHDLATVQQICTNVAILQNGECIYSCACTDTPLNEIYLKVTKEHKNEEK